MKLTVLPLPGAPLVRDLERVLSTCSEAFEIVPSPQWPFSLRDVDTDAVLTVPPGDPSWIHGVLDQQRSGELILARPSRYVPTWAEGLTVRLLGLPVQLPTSAARLYHRQVFKAVGELDATPMGQVQAVATAHAGGWLVKEVCLRETPPPMTPDSAWSFIGRLGPLMSMRSSVLSADYDHRAYDSPIPLQRYWQRERKRIVTRFLDGRQESILDIGCGSSRIIQALPGAVGLDVHAHKLRFLRRTNSRLAMGSLFELPFHDASFETVICSEVIEHVRKHPVIFHEFRRVLRPGGTLILGTPDYGTIGWPLLEWIYGKVLPGAYADEHISPYTAQELWDLLPGHGFEVLEKDYVFRSALILKARRL